MIVDSHAHLFLPNFNGDLDAILQRAKEAGVEYILVPATDIATSAEAIQLAEKHKNIYAAVGVHPHDTKGWEDEWIDKIEELTQNPKVVAIGEIGLDYYYDFSPRETQIKAFKAQLDLAVKLKLPVIIHNREASSDVMEIIRSYKGSGLRAQFHCFAGTKGDAKELIQMGHFVSFAGNLTFKKSDTLREIAASIQIDNMLLETDSPFLTPEPFRGKRNEPAYIVHTAKKLAEIQNLSFDDITRTTTYSAYKLFGIGTKPKLSYTYKIGNSLYVNITNRCNADCVFCDRKGEAMVKGYNLKMSKEEEPPAEVYIKEIGNPKQYKEVVFCGYGEPTIRWDVVKQIAKYVKENGGKTRLNTDGHGNAINKRDITEDFPGLIDEVSISLNSPYPEQYAALMRIDKKFFYEMVDFAKKAKRYSHVVMTIVELNEVDSEKAKKFVKEELGVDFREREYFYN